MWFGSSRFHGVILVFLRNVFAIVPMTTIIKSSGGKRQRANIAWQPRSSQLVLCIVDKSLELMKGAQVAKLHSMFLTSVRTKMCMLFVRALSARLMMDGCGRTTVEILLVAQFPPMKCIQFGFPQAFCANFSVQTKLVCALFCAN
jgi:hypothetical protein